MKIQENRFFQFLVFVLMIMVIAYLGALINQKNQTSENQVITVSGNGEVYATPDVGLINISVKTEARDVATATNDNSVNMNEIISFIKSSNVEEKDIKTTRFNINPIYAWEEKTGKRNLTGYEVYQTINVKIRDLNKVGSVISGATERGANDVSSLSFIVDDDEKVKEEAKNLAIKDAQAKAKNLEKALGVKMVKIINFSENSYNPVYSNYDVSYEMLKSSGTGDVPSIQTGQNKITSTVTITYAIR
ncbi:MAG: SIMPL domain-containing protein [Candidatus Paceibacterota bacterium]|jgi:hypothetical protein